MFMILPYTHTDIYIYIYIYIYILRIRVHVIFNVILWASTHGRANIGRLARIYLY